MATRGSASPRASRFIRIEQTERQDLSVHATGASSAALSTLRSGSDGGGEPGLDGDTGHALTHSGDYPVRVEPMR